MQHTPAPEYDAETIEAAAARVAAMNLSADKEERHAIENDLDREPTPQPAAPPKPTKPERKTITVDMTDEPETYAQIKELAYDDDRTPAAWLRRYIVARYLAGHLKTPPAVTK
jgi:hypothetical protein